MSFNCSKKDAHEEFREYNLQLLHILIENMDREGALCFLFDILWHEGHKVKLQTLRQRNLLVVKLQGLQEKQKELPIQPQHSQDLDAVVHRLG